MSSSLYSLYYKKNLDLARSIVIKHEMIAEAINSSLRLYGYDVSDNTPESWKYYLNLSGQYHVSDTMMQVISLDTLETIDFTISNLEIHKATKRAYLNRSEYYKTLVGKYPNQVTLIDRILNPIDINKAITANNYTIIGYNKNLIEENEYNLVNDLQSFIDLFFIRWHVADYYFVDKAYLAYMYGILCAFLVNIISNIRLKYLHTEQVHSYHVGEFLASHGGLDVYIDYLTKKQQLFLYRNIRYIYSNVGKRKTFDLLVQKILTDRNLPLASYRVEHNTDSIVDSLKPNIELVRQAKNQQAIDGRDEFFTVNEILTKELGAAKDNITYIAEDLPIITTQLENAIVDKLPIKVLESDILDDSLDGVYDLYTMLIMHWGHLAFSGLYSPIVTFNDPLTNNRINLRAKDAFIFYVYCLYRASGVTLDTIPRIYLDDVRKVTKPTFNELQSIVEKRYVKPNTILHAINSQNDLGFIVSTEAFYDTVNDLYLKRKIQRLEWSSASGFKGRMNVKMLYGHFYKTYMVNLVPTTTNFDSWLLSKGLDVSSYATFEFTNLYTNIAKNAVGIVDTQTKTLKQIQDASIAIMSKLSSYTVQYVKNINTEPYYSIDWPQICIDDVTFRNSQMIEGNVASTEILNIEVSNKLNIPDYAHSKLGITSLQSSNQISANGNIGVSFTAVKRPSITITGNLGTMTVSSLEINGVTYYDGTQPTADDLVAPVI